jgi:DNA-binding NtrC family response regulator
MVLSDRKVSRRHLSLEWQEGRLRLADLQSTNGSSVNGVAVEVALLHGGEVIRAGDTSLAVEAHADAATPPLSTRRDFGRMLGASLAMRRLYPVFEGLARSDVPVLIEGATGTGKELLAEMLHELGPRTTGPFVVVEATGGDMTSLELVLFGATPRDARGNVGQQGAFAEAHTGTLLIDDVAELSPSLQTRLLRELDRRGAQRDVRLLVATRRDLDREVENGNFREDLFHRLAVGRVELPPLRQREEDVSLLADHFWRDIVRDDTPFPSDLVFYDGYDWPGNVRELKNLVTRRRVMGSPLVEMDPGLTPPSSDASIIERVVAQSLSFSEARERVVAEFERVFVTRTLERHGGNVTKAATTSGLARRYFHRLKARHVK